MPSLSLGILTMNAEQYDLIYPKAGDLEQLPLGLLLLRVLRFSGDGGYVCVLSSPGPWEGCAGKRMKQDPQRFEGHVGRSLWVQAGKGWRGAFLNQAASGSRFSPPCPSQLQVPEPQGLLPRGVS